MRIYVIFSFLLISLGMRAAIARSNDVSSVQATDPDLVLQMNELNSQDPVRRAKAAQALGELGERATVAVPSLIERLGDGTSLGFSWSSANGSPIPALRQSTSPGREAAIALGMIKDRRAVEPLVQAAYGSDLFIKEGAIRALGKIRDVRALSVLFAIADEQYNERMSLASIYLSDWPDIQVDQVREWTHHQSYFIRMIVAEMLGKTDDPMAVDVLISFLSDDDSAVRRKAAKSLGHFKASRAIMPLITTAAGSDLSVSKAAIESLRTITGNDAGSSAEDWKKWYEHR